MIAASVLNTAGVTSSTVSLSKSTIHRQRQKQRQKSAQEIRQGFSSTKSVVHWDGKLLPDTDEISQLVDRIAFLLTSSEDSSTKLLGVPKLLSGTGKETADAVYGLLESWDIGTDTVGAEDTSPLVVAPTDVSQFLRTTMDDKHPRDDYLEFIHLAAIMVGLPVVSYIRRPGALNRARWMAKAIYSLKIELLFRGNEEALLLTGRQLQGLQRFNRFVILVYIQSWYSCSLAVDAAFNDIALINRLQEYDDVELSRVGFRMMVRHSWYLSPDLASLALFSNYVHDEVKVQLVAGMQQDRGGHLLTKLPGSLNELHASLSFFEISRLDSSFLKKHVNTWSSDLSYIEGQRFARHLACVNDVAHVGSS